MVQEHYIIILHVQYIQHGHGQYRVLIFLGYHSALNNITTIQIIVQYHTNGLFNPI